MSWVELPDIVLHAELTGGGPHSLVLLHELGGSLDSFDHVVARLSTGFRTLRYDQRGAGLSEKPRQPFGLDDQLRDLQGILAATGLQPPYTLAGVAAGCAVAVAYALAAPAQVANLLLCCPALTVPPERRGYLIDRSDRAAREGMRAIATASLDRSYPQMLRQDGRFDAYRARFIANDPVTYGHANRALADTDIATRLGDLAVPVHVLAGRHDLLRPPADVQAVAVAIPGASFAIVDSGHLMAVQAPDALAAALSSLTDRS
ncbi:alpha/beta fold hydrolase [Acidisphaera sp. L21]|uniref:alpha/beta fold hydrolase n=1 Tax=Acidisphaera sp. L21 TaxID=1641851 RepID=UPI00131DD1E2|nr:alpha/beta hydrolase [Acidisphaera sp. L21]